MKANALTVQAFRNRQERILLHESCQKKVMPVEWKYP